MALEKGYLDSQSGKFFKINESGSGGGGKGCGGCLLGILLFPFKLLFFFAFILPIKWPFYTFPRFLKRKSKVLFVIYILLWISLFVFSIVAHFNPGIMERYMEWAIPSNVGSGSD